MTNRMRIIGFGNMDRGDDAAGLLAARRLRELAVESEESTDALSLIESWGDADEVIIIDAVVTGATSGTVTLWENGPDHRLDFETRESSTHGFGVTQAIELGRTLDRLPTRIRIYGIEGQAFKIGTPPSPEVLTAVESLAQQLARVHSQTTSLES